jgi:hypothetical protein
MAAAGELPRPLLGRGAGGGGSGGSGGSSGSSSAQTGGSSGGAEPEAPPSRVVSLGSWSKMLAPGLRLGWAEACAPTLKRLKSCGVLISGGGCPARPAGARLAPHFARSVRAAPLKAATELAV